MRKRRRLHHEGCNLARSINTFIDSPSLSKFGQHGGGLSTLVCMAPGGCVYQPPPMRRTTGSRSAQTHNIMQARTIHRGLRPVGTHLQSVGQRLRSRMSNSDSTPKPGSVDKMLESGWFTEMSTMWPGQGLSLKIKEVLYKARSDFQDVCVFESESMGTVLLLDGVIQCTDRDEFSYQEMIAHVPMCSLERPAKKVLVVGGGDGGVLRELARYPEVEDIHMAEIDKMVPEVSKRFFPEMAVGFTDPRVTLHICDGIKFVEDSPPDSYDLIVVDSSDPVGPAEVLFEKPFFEALHRAVRPGGIVCTQAESLWLHIDIIRALASMCSSVFTGGSVSYASTSIPTYPSGLIGMLVCAKARDPSNGTTAANGNAAAAVGPLDPREPRQAEPGPLAALNVGELQYYSHEVHRAAFVLPVFARKALAGCLTFQ